MVSTAPDPSWRLVKLPPSMWCSKRLSKTGAQTGKLQLRYYKCASKRRRCYWPTTLSVTPVCRSSYASSLGCHQNRKVAEAGDIVEAFALFHQDHLTHLPNGKPHVALLVF